MATRGRTTSTAWTGWIGFASIMLTIIGAITFFEGLIAVIREEYYVVTGEGVLVFDLTTWGWIMLFWGVLLFLVGLGLAAQAGWARWTAIVLVSLNLIAQLGFLGSTAYPLWSLAVIAAEIIVIYALTVRWGDVEALRS